MLTKPKDIFDPAFASSLFDEMAETYGFTNVVASLGFTVIWRRLCVSKIRGTSIKWVCDFMTGMGD